MLSEERSNPSPALLDETIRPLLHSYIAEAPVDELGRILANKHLNSARADLWSLVDNNTASHRLDVPSLGVGERTSFFGSDVFKAWVESEHKIGNRVLWVTDLDKAMASGDTFVYFFDWRARHATFTDQQNQIMLEALTRTKVFDTAKLYSLKSNSPQENAREILQLWSRHERVGAPGIDLATFWREIYWPTLIGLSPKEKAQMVAAFVQEYPPKIFPGVLKANATLRDSGVEVVIVTNGDEDLAKGVAPALGIDPRNVAGVETEYHGERATGRGHFLEIFDAEWSRRPQPGKFIRLGCWAERDEQKARSIEGKAIVIAGFDGDSPGPDGGAMLFMRPKLGYFMVDTPGSHDQHRIKGFKDFVERYAHWHAERFIALTYPEPQHGPFPLAWE